MFIYTTMNGVPMWSFALFENSTLTAWNLKFVSSRCLQALDSSHLVTREQMPEERRQPLDRLESLTLRIAHLVIQRGFVVCPLGYVTNTWTGSTPYVCKQCFFSAAAKFTSTKARKLRIKDEIKFLYSSSFRVWMTAFKYLKQLLSTSSLSISFICCLFLFLYFCIWSNTDNRLIWKSMDSLFRDNPRRLVTCQVRLSLSLIFNVYSRKDTIRRKV